MLLLRKKSLNYPKYPSYLELCCYKAHKPNHHRSLSYFDSIFILGSKLTRLIYNNMTYNREEGSLNIDLAIPEAGFEYIGRLRLPSNPGSGIDLMDFIWMSGKPYFGYFIKVSAQKLEVSFLSHVWFLSQLL